MLFDKPYHLKFSHNILNQPLNHLGTAESLS